MSNSGSEPEDSGTSSGPKSFDCKHFDIDESFRYQPLGLLGRGGMGEVRAVLDLRLDREVALKVLQRSDPQAEARMAREASLAARLEHPGIVPIHSAGRLPDGHAYYTMRVIRGQSLSDALNAARDLPARLRLMRPFLDAAEAVAYAHDQGVLHRDLKPANVMMGEHGGTVVVDWGLAVLLEGAGGAPVRIVESPTGPAEATWAPGGGEVTWAPISGESGAGRSGAETAEIPSQVPTSLGTLPPESQLRTGPAEWELTRPGQVFGTPAFMSPEQARGEPLDRRSDVFSLGCVLFQVLTGRPPRQSADPHEAIPPVIEICPEAPPELVAITNRALHLDLSQRYPDAGALAADVEAWFEGRRVNAYTYSRWELLKRLIAAWRVPILVGAVALLCLAAAVGVGWWRTVTERNKALQAEENALSARAESDRYLAEALVAQALVAMDRGQRPRAEILAAHRLRYGENPEARGLLARFNGPERPRLVSHWRAPDCSLATLSADGERVLCIQHDGVQVLNAKGEVEHTIKRPIRQSYFGDSRGASVLLGGENDKWSWLNLETGAEQPLTMLDLKTPLTETVTEGEALLTLAGRSLLADPREGVLRPLPRCSVKVRPIHVALRSDGDLVLLCGTTTTTEITAIEVARTGVRTELFKLAGTDGVMTSMVVQEGPRPRVLVGTERGVMVVWDATSGAVRSIQTDLPDIANLSVQGDRALVQSVRGWGTVWDLNAMAPLVRLPDSLRGSAWAADGGRLRTIGAEWHEWSIPAVAMPQLHEAGGGVSVVAISSDARDLAWGLGTGQVSVVERETGDPVMGASLGAGVAKDVAFSLDGRTLATGTAGATTVKLFDLPSGALRAELPIRGVRRLAWLGSDLIGAAYQPDLLRWGPGATEPVIVPGVEAAGDLDPLVDMPGVVIVEDGGAVKRIEAGDAAPVRLATSATAQAIAGSRRYTYIVDSGMLRRFDRSGVETRVRIDSNRCRMVLEVGVAPRDEWIAVGCFTGAVLVYRGSDLQEVAALTGHTGRVGTLDFDGSGRWLVSGGWEGTVRVWDMSVLDEPAEALVQELEAAWGMGLQDAIGD